MFLNSSTVQIRYDAAIVKVWLFSSRNDFENTAAWEEGLVV